MQVTTGSFDWSSVVSVMANYVHNAQ